MQGGLCQKKELRCVVGFVVTVSGLPQAASRGLEPMDGEVEKWGSKEGTERLRAVPGRWKRRQARGVCSSIVAGGSSGPLPPPSWALKEGAGRRGDVGGGRRWISVDIGRPPRAVQ